MQEELSAKELLSSRGDVDASVLKIISDVNNRSLQIPFGRSDFQLKYFVIAANKTPERAYQSILMELQDRTQAFFLARMNYRKCLRDIQRKMEKLESSLLSPLDKDDILDELETIKMGEPMLKKLVIDNLGEIRFLNNALKSFKEYTREEFEAGELEYYMQKLLPEAAMMAERGVINGPQLAINHITQDTYALDAKLKELALPENRIKNLLQTPIES